MAPQFAAGLDHEIRNPLAGIKAAVEILREAEKLSSEGLQMTAAINGEIEQIDRTLKQFLEFTSLPQACIEDFPLAELVASVCDDAGMGSSGRRINVSVPPTLRVRADISLLQKVVGEVVQNAIDHAAEPLAVRARVRGSKIVIRISSDGAPIEREIAKRVFEPFFSTRGRRAGLGLPIAQRRLAAMKGRIRLLPARNGFEIILPKGR